MALSTVKLIAGAMATVFFLTACAPPPPPPKDESTIAQVNVTGTQNQNPDKNGRPSPAIVHIYALKPGAPFDIGDPEALTGGPLGDLAESMTRIAKMVIMPGRTVKKVFELPAGTSDIGITVAYRDFATAGWRASKPVKPKDVTLLKATIGTDAVSIE
ncbi:MAG: type VI secretion system lipoprotein TssJ [Pseudomonadota bacterium]